MADDRKLQRRPDHGCDGNIAHEDSPEGPQEHKNDDYLAVQRSIVIFCCRHAFLRAAIRTFDPALNRADYTQPAPAAKCIFV